jgi:replicative DNA helicase
VESHEPKYPIPDDPPEVFAAHDEWKAKYDQVAGAAELIVAKQRHGATGKERLRFDGRITKFSDAADDAYLPEVRG